jgi:hypothetical protein
VLVSQSGSGHQHGLGLGADFAGRVLHRFIITDADFQTIKVQLRALGLIAKSTKPRSVKDIDTYWTLTSYGDTVMTRLRAIQRNLSEPKEGERSPGPRRNQS